METIRLRKRPEPLRARPRGKATLSEAFSDCAVDAAVVGGVLSHLPQTKAPILWVQDRMSRKQTGRPCLAGIGTDRPVIVVDLSRASDVLGWRKAYDARRLGL